MLHIWGVRMGRSDWVDVIEFGVLPGIAAYVYAVFKELLTDILASLRNIESHLTDDDEIRDSLRNIESHLTGNEDD